MLRSLWKYLVHALTGQAELERIILKHHPRGEHRALVRRFRRSLMLSKQLARERDLVLLPATTETTKSIVVDNISSRKQMSAQARPGLVLAVNAMQQTSLCVASLVALARQPYSHEEHEDMLMELWDALRPGQKLEGRHSQSWGEIGFQGMDPATDFRGGGVLSLENLRFFASRADTCELARGILRDHGRDVCEGGIPFACVGINLTAFLLDLVARRKVDDLFVFVRDENNKNKGGEREPLLSSLSTTMAVSEEDWALDRFNKCYCVLFVLLARRWAEAKPKDAMAFPGVFGPFKKEVERVLSTSQGVDALMDL